VDEDVEVAVDEEADRAQLYRSGRQRHVLRWRWSGSRAWKNERALTTGYRTLTTSYRTLTTSYRALNTAVRRGQTARAVLQTIVRSRTHPRPPFSKANPIGARDASAICVAKPADCSGPFSRGYSRTGMTPVGERIDTEGHLVK
jgi:hypothetical protein